MRLRLKKNDNFANHQFDNKLLISIFYFIAQQQDGMKQYDE
jgi:hypothetical protein